MLLHGTVAESAVRICRDGFSTRHAARRSTCGAAVYLADSATKADEYASPEDPGAARVLVISRVLGGVVHYTADAAPDKEELTELMTTCKCDTILNDREACRGTFKEFAVARPHHALPECVVYYSQLDTKHRQPVARASPVIRRSASHRLPQRSALTTC